MGQPEKGRNQLNRAKPFSISKKVIVEAYKRIKSNGGSAGVDEKTMGDFEKDLKNNLYKIWNRMSSGSYFPQLVKEEVQIPKYDGSIRPLGIPTIEDRIAQMVVKIYLEPKVELVFHEDSYGYRRGKSAHDTIEQTRKRCWKKDWVIDIDIKGFFDNIDHRLMMEAVEKHTKEKWIRMYIARWLKADIKKSDGTIEKRTKGTP